MSAATDKMRAEGLSEAAVETFAHYERLLREGEQGTLPESSIEPLEEPAGRRRSCPTRTARRSGRPWC